MSTRQDLRTSLISAASYSDGVAGALLTLCAAAYYLSPFAALSLLLLAILAVLIWRFTAVAVVLVPLAMPFYMLPKSFHLVRTLSFSLGETVIVLCTVVVLLQQLLSAAQRPPSSSLARHFFPSSPFDVPAVVFLVAAIIATLAARYHTPAFRQFREVLLEPLLFYWLIRQRAWHGQGAVRVLLAAIGAGVVVAVLGWGQLLFRPQDLVLAKFAPGQPHLVRAVYGNENNLALLLDRALPMALALLLFPGWEMLGALRRWAGVAPSARDTAQPVAGDFTAVRVALAVAVLLMGSIVYETQSRGGELTVALCTAVLLAYWQRRRPALILTAVAAVLLAALLEWHRIWDKIAYGHGLTTDARLSVWQSALRMVRDHPLFGVGPDNFLYYYSNDSGCAPGHVVNYYYQQRNAQGVPVNFEPCLNHPHNLFLDLWLSTGLLGLLAGVALLVLFAVLGLRAFRRAGSTWKGPLLAALIAVLALVTHGQVDNSYFLPDLAVDFWLCLAVVAIWYARQDEPAAVQA